MGAARAGTTALAEMIADACGLDLARGKETHFLASAALGRPSGGPDGDRFDRSRARTKKEFDSYFPRGGSTRILDASASSLYYAPSAVSVLDEFFPDAHLVAVLRDPVRRAASAHRFMVARGLETLPFETALRAEATRIEDGWSHIWHYARAGLYSRQIEALARWRSRTLFLLYETDLRDPLLLADRVSAHIGHPIVNAVRLRDRNQARPFLTPGIGRGAERLRALAVVRRAPAPVRALGRRAVAPLRRRSEPSPVEVGSDLREVYRGESARVHELTGLPAQAVWGLE
jgi:hypothetical protein